MPLSAGDKLGPNEFKDATVRFQTRPGNRGLMLGASLSLLVSSSLRLLFLGSHHAASRWIAGLQFVCSLLLVLSMSPSYCEFDETSLILRQGWRRKFSVPYGSLAEIKLIAPPPGKFVPGRILIAARDGKRLVISVVESARFLREADRRCPQLNSAAEGA
jgi:hypothetical protein